MSQRSSSCTRGVLFLDLLKMALAFLFLAEGSWRREQARKPSVSSCLSSTSTPAGSLCPAGLWVPPPSGQIEPERSQGLPPMLFICSCQGCFGSILELPGEARSVFVLCSFRASVFQANLLLTPLLNSSSQKLFAGASPKQLLETA